MLSLPAKAISGVDMVGTLKTNEVYCMNAIKFMRSLPDKSVDAYITDLPYGTTACSWDEIIPFAPMWAEVKRTLKPRGVFVTTASQPFTSKLVMSNVGMFKYEWIWDKSLATGFLDAPRRPLKQHENIVVFSEGQPAYYPQMKAGLPYKRPPKKQTPIYGVFIELAGGSITGDRYPKTIIDISNADRTDTVHPTQKPIALYDYLIRTYTQPGELVVDFCCGSGTTGVAARQLERRYILNDITPEYVDIANKRLDEAYTPLMPLFLEQTA